MHLNIIMKLGLCTIPHLEDIAPCNIFNEASCCCYNNPNPLHVATPSMQKKSPENTGRPGIER